MKALFVLLAIVTTSMFPHTAQAGIMSGVKKAMQANEVAINEAAGATVKVGPGALMAQMPALAAEATSQVPSAASSAGIESMTRYATTLTLSFFGFGALCLVMVCVLAFKGLIHRENLFKSIGLIFVVTVAIVLIPAGYDQAQITPAVALLGTVTGYLFGKSPEPERPKADGK